MEKYNEWSNFSEFDLHSYDKKSIGRLAPLSFNSTTGVFKMESSAEGFDFGQDFLLICRSQINNVEIILQVKIIKKEGPQITVLYLKCLEQNEIKVLNDTYEYYLLPDDGPTPNLWGKHPWFISEKIFGFIIGVHSKSIKVRFKLDRLSLMPGMIFNLNLSFPGVKEQSFLFKILRGNTTDHFFIAEVEVVKKDAAFAIFLGRCVAITYSDYSFDQFKNAGLVLPNFRWASHVELITNESSIRECLELRKIAYTSKSTSRFVGNEDIEHFRDQFDKHSILMLIKMGAKPIGTGRITFNNGDLSKSEIAQLTDLSSFVSDKGYVEASRFATHPDYRGRDVFLLMLYLSFKLCLLAGYHKMIIDCEDHLLPIYKKIGGRELGIRFSHPLEGVSLNLIQFDLDGLVSGKGISFFTWLVIITPLLKHLHEVGLLQLTPYRLLLVLVGNQLNTLLELQRNFNK